MSPPRRHEGFMVATMNPLSWDVVLHSDLDDRTIKRGGAVTTEGTRSMNPS
jgi:hypothetical protein